MRPSSSSAHSSPGTDGFRDCSEDGPTPPPDRRLSILRSITPPSQAIWVFLNRIATTTTATTPLDLDSQVFSFGGGSMELMAVPKRKVSPHKRGIRNGPKALKPVPVIIRCKSCGRVKLPHFYCCSGHRENIGKQNGSSS